MGLGVSPVRPGQKLTGLQPHAVIRTDSEVYAVTVNLNRSFILPQQAVARHFPRPWVFPIPVAGEARPNAWLPSQPNRPCRMSWQRPCFRALGNWRYRGRVGRMGKWLKGTGAA